MHVILTILKIIGIILLVILGILLLLLLAVLFVPLRYQAHVRKEKKDLEADGRVTWLLHLLRVDMTIRDLKGTVVIRACGFRLKTIHFLKQDEETEEKAVGKTAAEEIAVEEAATEDTAAEENAAEETAAEENAVEENAAEKRTAEQKAAEAITAKAEGPQKSNASGRPGTQRKSGKAKKAQASKTHRASKEKPLHEGFAGRIVKLAAQLVNTALDLLAQVPALPAETYDKIDSVQKKLYDKYDAAYRKAEPFLSIEAEHVFERCIRYLKYLIRGYAPRKIRGYIHFGTGAPDLTGKLTGLIYMLLPEAGTEYEVDPDFYEAVLDTDTFMKGRIRSYRVVWVGIRLLLDKEARILLRRIRGKEKTARHRGLRRSGKKAA